MKPGVRGSAGRRRMGGYALVLFVLLAGGTVTSTAGVAVVRGQDRLAKLAMDHHIADTSALIIDEVGHYRDALADLAAAISTQPRFTAATFHTMTARLDQVRLPGASDVTFVAPAHDTQLIAVRDHWRARGAEGLSVYPSGTDTEHKYVVMIRTFSGSVPILGQDLAYIKQTSAALDTARMTNEFTVGSALVIRRDRSLPEDRQQVSFTLIMPVYAGESGFLGWICMVVRGGGFLNEKLRSETQGRVRLQLTDPAPDAEPTIVDEGGGTLLRTPGLNRSHTLPVGRHLWRLSMQPTTKLLGDADRRQGWLTVLAGSAFTLLLALLIAVLSKGRNQAMDRVDQATAALRQDIQRRQAVEEKLRERELELRELAFHDQLTGLANRVLFYDRVTHALQTHTRAEDSFAVFFIDLDGFKQVNDVFGHSGGDRVLRVVADRLTECLRESDTVARFGGDEFAVLIERLTGPESIHVAAQRIVAAVQRPITVGNAEAVVTASVGIALNRPDDTADDILREADLAMYTAKTTGKSRHVLAAP